MKIEKTTIARFTYDDLYDAVKYLIVEPIKSQLDTYVRNRTEINWEDFIDIAKSVPTLLDDFYHLVEIFVESDKFVRIFVDNPDVSIILFEKPGGEVCYQTFREKHQERIEELANL